MPELLRGDGVVLEVDLGVRPSATTIKGCVIRRSPETCVLQLDGQIRDGRARRFRAASTCLS